jgi:hypothetical protein
MRELVNLTFCFEVKDEGWITHDNNGRMSNMLTRTEIYSYVKTFDPRIPPLEEYIEEDSRPCLEQVPVIFRLKGLSPVTDLSDKGPGRLGGDNGSGMILPPIIYAAHPINTKDPSDPKVSGSKKGQLSTSSGPDSCPTDSEEDTDDYAHRLARIQQAIYNQEQVMTIFVGTFQGFQDIQTQCEFRLIYNGPSPQTIREFFESNWSRIRDLATRYGSTSVPGSLTWTLNPISDESMSISSYRFGKGLKVRFQPKDISGIEMSKWPAVFTTDLMDGLSIAFPAPPRLPDAVLMQLFANLTAPWDGKSFGTPWQTYLIQQNWRKSETGEIYLLAASEYPEGVDPHAYNPRIPTNAASSNSSRATNDKEVSRTLKFARDNGWPLLLSCVSTLDGMNAITVTYETKIADCDDTIPWYWTKFLELAAADQLVGLPVIARVGVIWTRICEIEYFKIHIYLTELGVHTHEVDGPPFLCLYAPRATLKVRCESLDIAFKAVTICYNRDPDISEKDLHHSREWGLVASLFG